MPNDYVYLDHAATTPLDERVLDVMLPHLSRVASGNPSSLHTPGAVAREAIEEARESVARLVGAWPDEIVFTSGGTESDNMAVLGLASVDPRKKHLVVSAIEHPAVRGTVEHLEAKGYEVTRIGVDMDGFISPGCFADALRQDTALAAVLWASNEVGTLQPIEQLAEICCEKGVPLHADAVQVAGRTSMDVSRVPISTLALSAHKLYGPQGVGALYVRRGIKLRPAFFGGGQEKGLRSGTENVAGIAGFGVAARCAFDELEERVAHEETLRNTLIRGTLEMPCIHLNGHRKRRLSNNVHLSVEGVEAESLVLFLDALGYAVGSGSACASNSANHKASPVLLAMGRPEKEALSAVRVTVGKDTTQVQIRGFLEAFSVAIAQLRELSPLYASKS
ncbi:MAG: cysteine desulfurase [Rubrobacter sp.]|nr:cysteine desulfurase [Rubrobacter sp.]